MSISSIVFKILTSTGSGSGFYINDKKIIVTNYHVVRGNRVVAIENESKERYVAHVIFVNPDVDLAFIACGENFKVEASQVISINELIEVKGRDKVYVLGFPYGMPYTETEGIVSSPNQILDGRSYIQTDAAINPGNSGGPIVNNDGNLVGVATSKFNDADNVGFGIPLKTLKGELDDLVTEFSESNFSLKCNSCGILINEKTSFCSNCGATIDEKIFDDTPLTQLATFVESSLTSLGINPVLGRNGTEFWEFYQGSSLIRIFVFNKEYIYATSPLNDLPKQGLEKLYSYILSRPVPPYKLGIDNNQIYISYRVHISDAFSKRSEDVKSNLTNLALKADELDDFFVEKFGCEMTNYSKIP